MMTNEFPPCPNCKRKGLHYANNPHAQGYKNYDMTECRFCHARFRMPLKPPQDETQPAQQQPAQQQPARAGDGG